MPNRPTRKQSQTRTPLSGHRRDKKILTPPLADLGLSELSWMNDRLPEMIWSALILVSLGRERGLHYLGSFLKFIASHPKRTDIHDVTLTGFSKLPEPLLVELVSKLTEEVDVRSALEPLPAFKSLPARAIWQNAVGTENDLKSRKLFQAVAECLHHQSQLATDCRWVRLVPWITSGKFQMPKEHCDEILGYPHIGDQRKVRPSIRAAEMMAREPDSIPSEWAQEFWSEGWIGTPCLELERHPDRDSPKTSTTLERVNAVFTALGEHWESTLKTTSPDAKHSVSFGFSAYALQLLAELMATNLGRGALSRLVLRTLLEIKVTFGYLLTKDQPELWTQFRRYGAGQAKLVLLKLEERGHAPEFLDTGVLEQICNEDKWDELISINIGHWDEANLRQLSVDAGLKDLYDNYYPWTSGYVHGTWGSIRESVFRTCGNPLHRLHSFPLIDRPLFDATSDACVLVDAILGDLAIAYSPFEERVIIAAADSN